MKLIINIPEESYKAIKAGLINSVIQNIWFDSVRNGTPLDDIKAEIENYKSHILDNGADDKSYGEMSATDLILNIIDEYIGGEKKC